MGSGRPELFSGADATTTLKQLFALLDGRRTVAEIAQAVPNLSTAQIHKVVLMLYSRGLLEEGCDKTSLPPSVESYLARYIDTTRLNSRRSEFAKRLQSTHIAIAGPREIAEYATSLLHESGVSLARAWPGDDMSLEGYDLAVIFHGAAGTMSKYFSAAQAISVPALAIRFSENSVAFGPLVDPPTSLCYSCYETLARSRVSDSLPRNARFLCAYLIGLLVQFVARVLIPPVHNASTVITIENTEITTETLRYAPMPACASCGSLSGAELTQSGFDMWTYHVSAGMVPAHLRDRRSYQLHYLPRNVQLGDSRGDRLYGANRVALPAFLGDDLLPYQDGTMLARLGVILKAAAGFRNDTDRSRIAPTGGNLKSPELYVTIPASTISQAGTYRYCPDDHALEFVSAVTPAMLSTRLGTNRRPDVAYIVGSGRLAHVFRKYSDFAFRVVGLDAGVALAYIHRIANALGMSVSEQSLSDMTDILDYMNVRTMNWQNVATFAVAVNVAKLSNAYTPLATPMFDALLYGALKQDADSPSRVPKAVATLESTLKPMYARRSSRVFAHRPLQKHTLLAMFRNATDELCRRVNAGARNVNARILLAAQCGNDIDLAAGIFAYDGQLNELYSLKLGLSYTDVSLFVTQENLQRAPYIAIACVDLSVALPSQGNTGYLHALSHAGSLGALIALEATERGLASCLSAGLAEPGLRKLLPIDGFRLSPMFIVCFGANGSATPVAVR